MCHFKEQLKHFFSKSVVQQMDFVGKTKIDINKKKKKKKTTSIFHLSSTIR